jgi:hypothetical protein
MFCILCLATAYPALACIWDFVQGGEERVTGQPQYSTQQSRSSPGYQLVIISHPYCLRSPTPESLPESLPESRYKSLKHMHKLVARQDC